jgi:hypothetical protein
MLGWMLTLQLYFFNAENEESTVKVKEKLKSIGYPSIDVANTFASKAKSFVSCATGKISS